MDQTPEGRAMDEAREAHATVLLGGFEGAVVDQLLFLAGERGGPHIAKVARAARIGLRESQPAERWAVTAVVRAEVQRLIDGAEPVVAAIATDAMAVARGELGALDAERRWGRVRPPFDPEVEFAAFRTAPAFEGKEQLFNRHIEDREPLEVIIRGHLWIEAILAELIDFTLPHPDRLNDARMSFSQKAALASALGLIDQDEREYVRRLNRIRNRLAHQLDAEVVESDQADLLRSDSGPLIPPFRHLREYEFPEGISTSIALVVLVLHDRLDEMRASQRYNEYLVKIAGDITAPRSDK